MRDVESGGGDSLAARVGAMWLRQCGQTPERIKECGGVNGAMVVECASN